MNSSAHMKLAIERCVPKKREYVDVLRYPFCALPKILNVPSIEQLASQKNVLNPLMIEKYKSVKPWIKVVVNSLGATILLLIVVSGNGLCALDDNCKGWLLDEFLPTTPTSRIYAIVLR
ncbi:hypothetical protein Tco_1316451 [Tanacetum coccineum]